MSLSDFTAKRILLQTLLLWGGLLFGVWGDDVIQTSYTTSEILVQGGPLDLTTTSTSTSTITITTTITYRPTLAAGTSNYTLLGCYSQQTGNGGNLFGPDEHDACSDTVPTENLTIDTCLEGCGSLPSPKNKDEMYQFAGLRNGSECICGIKLSAEAKRLTGNDCLTPCPGDPKLSCGGPVNVAVYSLGSTAGAKNGKTSSNVNSGSSTKKSGTTPSSHNPGTTDSTSSSSASKPNPDDIMGAITGAAAETKNPKAGSSGSSPRPVSKPAVAAITGSFSGAILLGAGLFVCLRWHKRRKRVQEIHVKTMLERRGGKPPPDHMILTMTTAHNHDDINIGGDMRVRRKSKDSAIEHAAHDINATANMDTNERDLRLTADGDLVPTTPALESGSRYQPGLHPRIPAVGDGMGPQRPTDDRESLYHHLLDEVRSGPAGASSAVQWRDSTAVQGSAGHGNGTVQHNTAHRRTASSTIPSPPPSAKMDAPLGERAWHRRKLSTSFQPPGRGSDGSKHQQNPSATSIGIAIGGAGAGAGVGAGIGGRNLARAGPPSLPPKAPLPPTPQGRRSQPPRARRSSFGAAAEPTIPNLDDGYDPSRTRALGMSHANTSTPSLGRYGSISRRPTDDDYDMESPVLGRTMYHRFGGGTGTTVHDDIGVDHRTSAAPAPAPQKGPWLPPVAPGARFDHTSWRGTIYGDSRKDMSSPLSASSVGTSILYDKTEFDRGR